jgi:glycerophosphoryl diester phosphodiesterase
MKVVKPLLSDLIDSVEAYLVKKNLPKVNYNIETKSLPAGDNRFHPVPSEFAEFAHGCDKRKDN